MHAAVAADLPKVPVMAADRSIDPAVQPALRRAWAAVGLNPRPAQRSCRPLQASSAISIGGHGGCDRGRLPPLDSRQMNPRRHNTWERNLEVPSEMTACLASAPWGFPFSGYPIHAAERRRCAVHAPLPSDTSASSV